MNSSEVENVGRKREGKWLHLMKATVAREEKGPKCGWAVSETTGPGFPGTVLRAPGERTEVLTHVPGVMATGAIRKRLMPIPLPVTQAVHLYK